MSRTTMFENAPKDLDPHFGEDSLTGYEATDNIFKNASAELAEVHVQMAKQGTTMAILGALRSALGII